MRPGRVEFTLSVVVDLDSDRMVEIAENEIIEGIGAISTEWTDAQIKKNMRQVEDASMSEADIDDTVKELMDFEEDSDEE